MKIRHQKTNQKYWEKKVCTKCKIEKLLINFNKKRRNKDGYEYTCRGCVNKYFKDWRRKTGRTGHNRKKHTWKAGEIPEHHRPYMPNNLHRSRKNGNRALSFDELDDIPGVDIL